MPLLYGWIAGYSVRRPAAGLAGRLRFASTAWRARLRCLFGADLRTLRRGVLRLLAISTLRTGNEQESGAHRTLQCALSETRAGTLDAVSPGFHPHAAGHDGDLGQHVRRDQGHQRPGAAVHAGVRARGDRRARAAGLRARPAGARRQPFALVGAALGHDDHAWGWSAWCCTTRSSTTRWCTRPPRKGRWSRAAFPR